MTRLWLVRLGRYGEQETHALRTGELITGWELDDISGAEGRDDILAKVQAANPTQKNGTLQNWSVQLNQFARSIADGDLVVVPLKTAPQLAFGRFKGGYVHTSDNRPARNVEWLRTDVPRSALKQDLLYSLGATQTVCEISRNDALRRVEALLATGRDPGPNGALGAANSQLSSGDDAISAASAAETGDIAIDLQQQARDQIERHIAAQFAGHAFTELIAAILRAQGYQARVSPPGADRGVDIVAGQGSLGFDAPRLVVQVKSGDMVVDQPTLQGLLGSIHDTHAEYGLLVSWSGFKSTVRVRANDLYFRVRLWDREQILDALFSVYEKLPEEIRAELPLRRVWALVPEDAEA
jgi:restriction system protein